MVTCGFWISIPSQGGTINLLIHASSQCKYDFLDFYPRGSDPVNVLSISNKSEIGQRWGRYFSIISEIQKFLNYPRGGRSSLIGNFSQIFPLFFSGASSNLVVFHQARHTQVFTDELGSKTRTLQLGRILGV